MRDISPTIICLLLGSLLGNPAAAEIFRWTDENGKVHFSDRPARDRASEKIEVHVNTYEGVSYATSNLQASEEVIIYSASWCGACKRAKRYFEANDIPYRDYDVEKSRKGRADYRRMKAKGVPVILVGRKRMNGFSESGFEGLYR